MRRIIMRNSLIHLGPDSKERKEATATLKYTLLLNYDAPSFQEKDIIDKIKTACKSCCTQLHPEKEYDFFGQETGFGERTSLQYFDYTDSDGKKDINDLILDHCIISSYHAVLTELLSNKTINTNEIANTTIGSGIFDVYEKSECYTLPDKEIWDFFQKYKLYFFTTAKNNTEAWNNHSRFTSSSTSHLEYLSKLKNIFLEKTDEKELYYFQFAFIYKKLCTINASKFKILNDEYTYKKATCYDYKKSLTNLIEKTLSEDNLNFHPVDSIYHTYIIKRIFNFDLFLNLSTNIHRIQTETNYRLTGYENLQLLSSCLELPNSLNRTHFLIYAFDKLLTKPWSYMDYWHIHEPHLFSNPIFNLNNVPNGFQFHIWIEQFRNFCCYIGSFLIPVYQWCFIDILLKSIETAYPKNEHPQNLYISLKYLGNYLKIHHKEMLTPLDTQEIQNINIDFETVKLLKNGFINLNRDEELNLALLNPKTLFHPSDKNYETNSKAIRDSYISIAKKSYSSMHGYLPPLN